MALLPLHVLRCPVDASRFLFSSLSSLHVRFEERRRTTPCPTPVRQSCLLALLLLLAANPDSFSSLRRLHIEEQCSARLEETQAVQLPVFSLARLRALTHCRIWLATSSALLCSCLVSALSSLQSLTLLDLDGSTDVWRQLLPLLSSDVATPLLLRLQTLVLSNRDSAQGLDALYDAFLCRLSSLPAPPALQRFKGLPVLHRAAGLLSVFTLPHLTLLDLTGLVRRGELVLFASSFTSAPAGLVSLKLPNVWGEADDRDGDAAAVAEDAAVVSEAARRLCSRFPAALRELYCDTGIFSGVVALPDSLPGNTTGGCSASLYRLNVRGLRLLPFPCHAPPSFPQLTELSVDLPLKNAELELLLSGCPQLLVLSCTVWPGWQVVHIAARCCPRLLDLAVSFFVTGGEQPAGHAAFTQAELDIGGHFLPQLIALRLSAGDALRLHPSFGLSSLLRHFTAPPYAQLQRLVLVGLELEAELVLSLACLPRLSHLDAGSHRNIAEVHEARRRTRQQLRNKGQADSDSYWTRARGEDCEGGVDKPRLLLGPHQQNEMRERVLQEIADLPPANNLLARVEGVHRDTVRAVFFAELRSLHTATATSDNVGDA